MNLSLENIEQISGEIYEECLPHEEGNLATYIPELAKVDPNQFAISILRVGGGEVNFGDFQKRFTFQSLSKTLSYALALQLCSRDEINRIVGTEPSGARYDSVIKLDKAKRPYNPMVNSGAIAIANLLSTRCKQSCEDEMRTYFSSFSASQNLVLNKMVWESEQKTADRNRAIGHLLKSFGIIKGDVEEALRLYFMQCSYDVTTRDLATIAATLANGGCHPLTGKQLINSSDLRQLLSVLLTCGMYNYAGQWIVEVGLPAKSGVSGGVMAVAPGKMGIGIFSPRLDVKGSSVRGIEACKKLSDRLDLHILGCG